VQAAYQAEIAALKIAQPRAIIVGAGAEMNNSRGAVASRTAAYKAGFVAAANGGPRMIWLDGSSSESSAIPASSAPDGVHPGSVFGASHLGGRLARHSITALTAIA
jgi:hypothetical protein